MVIVIDQFIEGKAGNEVVGVVGFLAASNEEVRTVCVRDATPGALPIVSAKSVKVLGEPTMSEAYGGYLSCKVGGEEALWSCCRGCPTWVRVGGVASLIKVAECIFS